MSMSATKHLSANLVLLRGLRGKSLVAYAGELGISKSTLQEIEQGHSPNLETVEQISRSLGIPAALLISDSMAPLQSSVLLDLFREAAWFSRWSPEDQADFLLHLQRLLSLYVRYIPHSADKT